MPARCQNGASRTEKEPGPALIQVAPLDQNSIVVATFGNTSSDTPSRSSADTKDACSLSKEVSRARRIAQDMRRNTTLEWCASGTAVRDFSADRIIWLVLDGGTQSTGMRVLTDAGRRITLNAYTSEELHRGVKTATRTLLDLRGGRRGTHQRQGCPGTGAGLATSERRGEVSILDIQRFHTRFKDWLPRSAPGEMRRGMVRMPFEDRTWRLAQGGQKVQPDLPALE